MVSAAGLAPAVPRFQAEHVAATPRAGDPDAWMTSGRRTRDTKPWERSRGKMWKVADPKGVAPSTLSQTTGRSAN